MPGTLVPSTCIAGFKNPSESPLKTMGITYFPFHVWFPGSNSLSASTKSVQKTLKGKGDRISMRNAIHYLKRNKKLHAHLYGNWLGPLLIGKKLHHPFALFSLSLVCPFDSGVITFSRGKHPNKATPPPLPFLLPHPTMTERPSKPGPEREVELNWFDFFINLLILLALLNEICVLILATKHIFQNYFCYS